MHTLIIAAASSSSSTMPGWDKADIIAAVIAIILLRWFFSHGDANSKPKRGKKR